MTFLPVCVNLEGRKLLVIGGGKVACEKLKTLIKYTDQVTVCAPEVRDEIRALGVAVVERAYAPDILAGFSLVFACTNDRELNRRVRQDAAARHLLTCVADDPGNCDFISPAIYKAENMSVAVSSNGEDVRRSVAWRNAIRDLFNMQLEGPVFAAHD
jgi:precorrin-2 dehydrogenase/sirohydrochlorin ferrochelatase